MKSEIARLNIELENLLKTIVNQKKQVRETMNELPYVNWLNYIDECEKSFKCYFSEEANRLLRYVLHYAEMLKKIATNTVANDNICIPFHENLLLQEIQNEFVDAPAVIINSSVASSSSNNDDSGLKNSLFNLS